MICWQAHFHVELKDYHDLWWSFTSQVRFIILVPKFSIKYRYMLLKSLSLQACAWIEAEASPGRNKTTFGRWEQKKEAFCAKDKKMFRKQNKNLVRFWSNVVAMTKMYLKFLNRFSFNHTRHLTLRFFLICPTK